MTEVATRVACGRRGLFGAALRASSALVAPAVLAGALASPAAAGPPPLFNATWLAGRAAAGASAGRAASGLSPSSSALIQRSMANLQRTADAIAHARAAQASARAAAAGTISTVPDGLVVGGLQPVPGATSDPGAPSATGTNADFQGALLPTQVTGGGRTTVTVRQTTRQAILNWQTFNVGRNTTLAFDQSAGGSAANTWVALNKVTDETLNPTRILGQITAPGQVYILNKNGIIFGATAQVSVGSLLAATAGFSGGDAAFLQTGIYGRTQADKTDGRLTDYLPAFTGATGAISVEPGAQLSTNVPSGPLSAGGFVMLLGTTVGNGGELTTPAGQAVLAAGTDFTLRKGYNIDASGSGNTTSTVRGSEVAVAGGGSVTNGGIITATTGDVSLVGGNVTQAGVIVSTTSATQRGTVHLLTPVARQVNPNFYELDDSTSVTLAPGSTTAIVLDSNGGTALDTQRAANIAASATNDAARQGTAAFGLNDQSRLTDRQDEGRIEITTGGLASFASGSLVLATGGQVAVSAAVPPGRTTTYAGAFRPRPATGSGVFVASGATIDVSGSVAATLPVADNAVAINVQGFELRDAPTNRDSGALNSQTVYVDQRLLVPLAASAGYATTRLYTSGGLLEVSGEVGNISHGIAEWTAPGGTITLASGDVTATGSGTTGGSVTNGQIVAQGGAMFDVAGGAITYTAGTVRTSWLIGRDGRLYNVDTAPANVSYAGVFGGFAEAHARWGVTNVFDNPLIAPSERYEAGYTVGRDAGQVLLSSPTVLFQGTIDAGVVTGERQTTARSATITDPYLQAQGAVPQHGSLAVGNYSNGVGVFAGDVLIAASLDPVADTLAPGDRVASRDLGTATFSAADLSTFQLGGLAVQVGSTISAGKTGTVAVEGAISLAAGGMVTLIGAAVTLDAPITARGGAVTVLTQLSPRQAGTTLPPAFLLSRGTSSITLTDNASIDTRGLWTNAAAGSDLSGAGLVNGGNVSLDSSNALTLAAGSLIDASAGAALLPLGKTASGQGGNITLIADDPALGGLRKKPRPVTVDATLRSIGVSRGGAFVLEAPSVAVGDGLLPANTAQVVLPTAFFASGFSSYTIDGFGTAEPTPVTVGGITQNRVNGTPALTVAAGAQVIVQEPVYQFGTASSLVPTGGDPGSALQVSLLPEYVLDPTRARLIHRAGASLTLQSAAIVGGTISGGGGIAIGTGALLQVDSGQSIRVDGYDQVTVDGTLRAPGGAISVLNDRVQPSAPVSSPTYVRGLSVWIGADATLDAAGRAVTGQDRLGRPFGTVLAGGTVTLGAPYVANPTTSIVSSTNAAVIVRPGAVIDVSGTEAAVDPAAGTGAVGGAGGVGGTSTLVASDAGTIALSSYVGLFPDGTMRAEAGGAGARGGLLALVLETPSYQAPQSNIAAIPLELRNAHEIIVTPTQNPLVLADAVTPGSAATFAGQLGAIDTARIGTDQIVAGGFARLSLYTRDLLTFDGDVSLRLGESATLATAGIVDTSRSGHVAVSAPYLLIGSPVIGAVDAESANFQVIVPGSGIRNGYAFSRLRPCFGTAGAGCVSGTLELSADQIDVQNLLRFGAHGTLNVATPTAPNRAGRVYDRAGFDQVLLTSAGDIRFLPTTGGVDVASGGDITLAAAQVYAATPASSSNNTASVIAGVQAPRTGNVYGVYPQSVLTVARTTTDVPQAPLSTFSSLQLSAATVEQGGIVRAPNGQIILGANAVGNSFRQTAAAAFVEFLPGSITSASARGLTIPFGGTTNGITYSYAGNSVNLASASSNAIIPAFGALSSGADVLGVTLTTQGVAIDAGATIDLSGGGTLTGGGGEYSTPGTLALTSQGFVSGRGGSTDTLYTPFVTFNGGTVSAPAIQTGSTPQAGTVGVFAIVPSLQASYAPVTGFDRSISFGAGGQVVYAGSIPAVGEQVTITTATAGLPAGTYTLLPSYYALLPGAYRVELGTTPRATGSLTGALGNGSSVTGGYVGIANTGVRSAQAVSVTLTPGTTVRTYSQYDEQGYGSFETSVAAQFGNVRPALPQDAKQLTLAYRLSTGAQRATPALVDAGTVLLGSADGSSAGTVFVSASDNGAGANLELTADGARTAGFRGVSVQASELDALGAGRLVLGADLRSVATEVVVRGGATVSASEIDIASQDPSVRGPAVFVEPGATLTTVGRGPAPAVPQRGLYPAVGNGLFLANGTLAFDPTTTTAAQPIELGLCVTPRGCGTGTAAVLTDGALIMAGQVTLGRDVAFGADALTVAVPTLTLAASAPAGKPRAGSGFVLTQDVLRQLLAGDPTLGVAPLRELNLFATTGVDVRGAPNLSTLDPLTGQSSLGQLVLTTPVINGFGKARDIATISTGTFIWSGGPTTTVVSGATVPITPPGSTGTGSGTLDVIADTIVLGYSAQSRAASSQPVTRAIGGFGAVNLTATGAITTTGTGDLSVYQSPGPYVNGQGFVGTGGVLTLATPLLTGGAGSALSVIAGGGIVLRAPAGLTPSLATTAAQGAEITLAAPSITDTTAIVLPAGRLVMTASNGNIVLGSQSRTILAGPATALIDQVRYSPGGSVVLESTAGNITEAADALIDVSSVGAAGGSLAVTATSGTVALLGTLLGGGPGGDGSIDVRAGALAQADFTDLNERLNAGQFLGRRAFDIAQGSLAIGNDASGGAVLRGHLIELSVDGGSLLVSGLVDASGTAPGTIRLAARDGLTLGSTAILDAHGTVAQVDQAGGAIDARNTGSIELALSGGALGTNQTTGTLTVQPGAILDVSAAAGVRCALGACGKVEFDVPRLGGAQSGDLAIAAPGSITIRGAGSVAVNAFWLYAPAGGVVTQAVLDAAGQDSTAFIAATMPGGTLSSALAPKLTGLTAYTQAFHLRPGVEIDSATATGTLDVVGDLDLSRYRYASLNPSLRGSGLGAGEAGVLVLRAGGDLTVGGSINDGFGSATPLRTPDDQGWVLRSGEQLLGAVVVAPNLPAPITLDIGTTVPQNATLTFAAQLQDPNVVVGNLTLHAANAVPAGVRGVTVARAVVLTSDWRSSGSVQVAGGQTYPAGATIPAGTTLTAGTVLAPGATLPQNVDVFVPRIPAGTPLTAFANATSPATFFSLAAQVTLAAGAVLPAGSTPVLADGARAVALRPVDAQGAQGMLYGALPMLPAGSQSWSIRLVAGADTTAADSRVLQASTRLGAGATATDPAPGSLVLSDMHFSNVSLAGPLNRKLVPTETFSVVRTGTGYLDLLAGGNVAEDTLFGVYTAGTQASGVASVDEQPRQSYVTFGTKNVGLPATLLGPNGATALNGGTTYEQVADASYAAYYPQGGGDLLVRAQRDVAGDVVIGAEAYGNIGAFGGGAIPDSNAVGNWLWRQGDATTPAAWWINFGSYVTYGYGQNSSPAIVLTGFTGFGALGGGNATVEAGRNAGYGLAETYSAFTGNGSASSALDVAVGATGRVADAGTLATGGGDAAIRVGESLNLPTFVDVSGGQQTADLYGTVTDLRGAIAISAGSIGSLQTAAGTSVFDPRPIDPAARTTVTAFAGPVVVVGDASAALTARSALVLTGAGDPTRETQEEITSSLSASEQARVNGFLGTTQNGTIRQSWFSLWQPTSSISLLSTGGDIVPFVQPVVGSSPVPANGNATATDFRYVYPPILDVTAASGSIYEQGTNQPQSLLPTALETAPSPLGVINFLAAQSIYMDYAVAPPASNRVAVDVSGADPSLLPTPLDPAYRIFSDTLAPATNVDPNAHRVLSSVSTFGFNGALDQSGAEALPLFAFEADNASATTRAGNLTPSRFYAVAGDIVNLQVGERLSFTRSPQEVPSTWLIGGQSVRLVAGRDIVNSGIGPLAPTNAGLVAASYESADQTASSGNNAPRVTGDLIVNANPSDVSEITAGRDVIYLNTQVAGPGRLLVQAGRNLYQADQGVIESLGVVDRTASSASGGAGITVVAGTGASGPDYAAFAELYANAANLADANVSLQSQPGRVPRTYAAELLTFLQENYGYTGTSADALAYFLTLDPVQQSAFVLPVFYGELNQAGLDFNNSSSRFYKTYLRGNTAIAALLPGYASGSGYGGAVTLFGGSGIRTDYGGDIQMLVPGGGITLGVEAAAAPPASSGVVTQGSGNVDIFANGSVLLGQSRVLTTFGGDILIWSRQGDINAGRGSKSTVLPTPISIVIDSYGNVTLSPTVPSSGAGIGSLAPIPSVPAGNVNLIAPQGTIDAGEAGIRASGNANLAALAVVNASNISVKGSTSGAPTIAVANIGALTAASAVAGSQAQAANGTALTKQTKQSESIITVEVIGFGP